MANITLLGASYTDVPAVDLPKTGGGTVRFYENGGTNQDYEDALVALGVQSDLADSIEALTTYANSVTGESDTTLSDAVHTLGIGYGGSSYSADDLFSGLQPSGDVTVTLSSVTGAPFAYHTAITKITAPNLNYTGNTSGMFQKCSALQYAILPLQPKLYNQWFADCPNLIGVDCLCGPIGTNCFLNDVKFNLLILRKTSEIATISNLNAFNNTPFASGKAGGTVYVPSALVNTYKANTNWATVLGYNENNQILSIENSIYETKYADGTPISTQ